MLAQTTSHSQPLIRLADPGDLHFFLSTWKQHFWQESPWANRIRWQLFKERHSLILQRLLARSEVLVACDPRDQGEIAGYIVFEPAIPALHWVYVKPSMRMAGVGTALLQASGLPQDLQGVRITHGSRSWFSAPPVKRDGQTVKPGRPGLEEKFPGAIHDPYLWMIWE